jgi:hypothetical protein
VLKLIWILATSLVFSLLTAAPSQAQAPYSKPMVTKIVNKKTSKNYASVRVYAKRNNVKGNNAVSPTPKIKVSIGKKSCVIKVSYGSCVIQKVRLNSRVTVKAVQFNKHGKSDAVKKRVKANSNTKVFYQVKGSTSTKRNKGKVLSTSQLKLQNVQAFNKSASTRSFRGGDNLLPASDIRYLNNNDPNQVVFDMSDAVALAKPETPGDDSGFYKLESDGSQSDPLVSGDITVQNFYIAPNDDVYADLGSKQALVTGGPECLLVKINSKTGVPKCIDSTIDSISWSDQGVLPAPVQFDSKGNIYYSGQSGNNAVFRMHSGGKSKNLINSNIEISAFYVAPNGDVIHCGRTPSSKTQWIRKLSSAGKLSTIKAKANCNFMQKFSDGNLWIGSWGGSTLGVLRYSLAQKKLISSPFGYVGSSYGLKSSGINLESYMSEYRVNDANQGFYSWGGSIISDSFNFPTTKQTWVIAGDGSSTDLVRYTPSLMIAETSLSNYTMGRRVLNTLILTGLDKNDVNRLILYDTQSGNETVVFDGRNEIEIYDMVFIAGTNKLMFSGLRFSDNQYVVGQVSL